MNKLDEIQFDSDDDLALSKLLKCPTMAIIVRSVFEEDGKFYPQIHLDECLYQLQKWYSFIKLKILGKFILIKLINQMSM